MSPWIYFNKCQFNITFALLHMHCSAQRIVTTKSQNVKRFDPGHFSLAQNKVKNI